MNKLHRSRVITIISITFLLSSALGLILYALKQNINLFLTPTDLLQTHLEDNQTIRIGGYVKKHSVSFNKNQINFVVSDRKNEIKVTFSGVLPNLFREGQVVIVTGKINSEKELAANQVLAKHDEKYMPKGLSEQLKQGDKRAA